MCREWDGVGGENQGSVTVGGGEQRVVMVGREKMGVEGLKGIISSLLLISPLSVLNDGKKR